jgi:cell division protein FtsB
MENKMADNIPINKGNTPVQLRRGVTNEKIVTVVSGIVGLLLGGAVGTTLCFYTPEALSFLFMGGALVTPAVAAIIIIATVILGGLLGLGAGKLWAHLSSKNQQIKNLEEELKINKENADTTNTLLKNEKTTLEKQIKDLTEENRKRKVKESDQNEEIKRKENELNAYAKENANIKKQVNSLMEQVKNLKDINGYSDAQIRELQMKNLEINKISSEMNKPSENIRISQKNGKELAEISNGEWIRIKLLEKEEELDSTRKQIISKIKEYKFSEHLIPKLEKNESAIWQTIQNSLENSE